MIWEVIYGKKTPRLILIFLGWGMEKATFDALRKPGYDICLVSNYAEQINQSYSEGLSQIYDLCCGYDEVIVIGWSFGVRVATDFLTSWGHLLHLSLTLAVNGTPFHVNDERGIPCNIFSKTVQTLNASSLRKFNRRMFVSRDEHERYEAIPKFRELEDLKNELDWFASLPSFSENEDKFRQIVGVWDIALIADNDYIFPTLNQLNAWLSIPYRIMSNCGHFPDFNAILGNYIKHKELISSKFSDANKTYSDNAKIQANVAKKLWQKALPYISLLKHESWNIVEVGSGSGFLTDLYKLENKDCSIELWDLASSSSVDNTKNVHFRQCDAETEIYKTSVNSIDILLSSSTLQWFNSPVQFLKNLYSRLVAGGFAAISFYGIKTFYELEAACGISMNYLEFQEVIDVLKNIGFEILDCEESCEKIVFDSVPEMLQHIKTTGVNALDGSPSMRTSLKLLRYFNSSLVKEISLTYNPMYFILRKPKI